MREHHDVVDVVAGRAVERQELVSPGLDCRAGVDTLTGAHTRRDQRVNFCGNWAISPELSMSDIVSMCVSARRYAMMLALYLPTS
jgi:hypothetical protein